MGGLVDAGRAARIFGKGVGLEREVLYCLFFFGVNYIYISQNINPPSQSLRQERKTQTKNKKRFVSTPTQPGSAAVAGCSSGDGDSLGTNLGGCWGRGGLHFTPSHHPHSMSLNIKESAIHNETTKVKKYGFPP